MTHPGVEQVAEHLEGLLPPDHDRRVRQHLAACPECATTAQGLSRVTARLRDAAGQGASIPADVDARVRDAIAAEARQRRGAADEETVAAPVPTSQVHAGSGVSDLDRHRRRRRSLAAGLLAAAAATVVAVGLGDALDGGALLDGRSGQGDSAAVAEQTGGRTRGRPGSSTAAGAHSAGGEGREPGDPAHRDGGEELQVHGGSPSAQAWVRLVESVADRHSADAPRDERSACVHSVLGEDTAGGASYAVRLPPGDRLGAVVLRPVRGPTVALLLDCTPRPRLVLRHTLPR